MTYPPHRRRVLHVLEGDFASGYFPDLARFADGDRYELLFTSLDPVPEGKRALLHRDGVADYVALGASPPRGARPRVWSSLSVLARLRRLLDRVDPDVVHSHLF